MGAVPDSTMPSLLATTTAALFDLDGTLLDSRPGIRAALIAALADRFGNEGQSAVLDASLPLDDMIRRASPAATPAEHQDVATAFRRHYDSGHWSEATLYPGAISSLERLHAAGVRLFVVTNKRTAAATRLLDHFGIRGYFDAVFGQADLGEAVAKADLIRRCLAMAGLNAADSVLIGDSDQDAQAAASCGIAFIAVMSGAGPLGDGPAGAERVEVAGLADAAASALIRHRGGRREP